MSAPERPRKISRKAYKQALHALQIQLVRLQRHVIDERQRILVLFEGRDAAGKDGTIKRVVQHLSPRHTRVVALDKPSDREQTTWYFQRYVPHLPAGGELVLFNRSWYNRAGVERVMGFCTDEEYDAFMETVPRFEHMLVRSGIALFKYYLDISRKEQRRRLEARRTNPLKQWKVSPIDDEAARLWDDYSLARNEMFARTQTPVAPWTVVRADDKRSARIQVIKDLLTRLDYPGKNPSRTLPDPKVVFGYDETYLSNGMIAP